MQDYNEANFLFDPDKLELRFSPFERILPGVTYTVPPKRVIAPIPNKADELKGEFIRAVYGKAVEFLTKASQIIVIGYSFNPNDDLSYGQLLDGISNKPVLVERLMLFP